jgi:hypothetical protein
MNEYYPFLLSSKTSVSNKFEDGSEVETVVTRWLIKQDTAFFRQGIEKLVLPQEKCLNNGWAMTKISGILVQ